MSKTPEKQTENAAGISVNSESFKVFREQNNSEEDMEGDTVVKFSQPVSNVGQGSPGRVWHEMPRSTDLKRKGINEAKKNDRINNKSPERCGKLSHGYEKEILMESLGSENDSENLARTSKEEEHFEETLISDDNVPEKLNNQSRKEKSCAQVVQSEKLLECETRLRRGSGSKTFGTSESEPLVTSRSEPRGTSEIKVPPGYLGLCAAVLIIISAVLVCLSKNNNQADNIPKKVENNSRAKFLADLWNLEKYFPEQDKRFYMIVSSATKSIILNENPNDPAVILLVVPEETHSSSTLECFLSKYVPIVTEYFEQEHAAIQAITFDASHHVSRSPDDVKLELDEALGNGFRKGIRVAVVKHLESLPAEAAKMFYSYCDNDNAPFKRVVIFLTLHLKGENMGQGDEFVERVLAHHWEKELGTDMFTPLMSRIGNSIAYLKSEKQENLENNGC